MRHAFSMFTHPDNFYLLSAGIPPLYFPSQKVSGNLVLTAYPAHARPCHARRMFLYAILGQARPKIHSGRKRRACLSRNKCDVFPEGSFRAQICSSIFPSPAKGTHYGFLSCRFPHSPNRLSISAGGMVSIPKARQSSRTLSIRRLISSVS